MNSDGIMRKSHARESWDKQGCALSSPYNLRKNRTTIHDLQEGNLSFSTHCRSLESLQNIQNNHFPAISNPIISQKPKHKSSPLAIRQETNRNNELPLISSRLNDRSGIKKESKLSLSLSSSLFDFRQPKAQARAKRKQVIKITGGNLDEQLETDNRYVNKPYEGCCDKFEYFDPRVKRKTQKDYLDNKDNLRSKYHYKRRSSSHSPHRNPLLDEFIAMNSVQRSSAPSTPSLSFKKKTFGLGGSKKKGRKNSKNKVDSSPSNTDKIENSKFSPQQRHVAFNTALPVASPEFTRAMKGIGTSHLANSLDYSDSSSEGTASPVYGGHAPDSYATRTVTFSGTSVKLYGGNVENEMADHVGPLDDSFAPRKSILKNKRRRSIDDLDVGTKNGLADYLESRMKTEKNSEKQTELNSVILKRLNLK